MESRDDPLWHYLDDLLSPAWTREVRRLRRQRILKGTGRLSVLLAFVAFASTLFGGPVAAWPMLAFFGALGAFCVFGPSSGTGPTRRLNRTRIAGL